MTPKDPNQARRVVADQEQRPDLSAESFSHRMRLGLLLITFLGEGLITWLVVAAASEPNGLLDVSPFLGVYVGGVATALGFFLMVIYGGLVGNNPRITKAGQITWFLMFVFLGPLSLPAYWIVHVWPAPYVPWTEPYQLDEIEQQAQPTHVEARDAPTV